MTRISSHGQECVCNYCDTNDEGTKIEVTFKSAYIETAVTLFCEEYGLQNDKMYGRTEFSIDLNSDDCNLRDVRSWGSYALGCGLVNSFTAVEH